MEVDLDLCLFKESRNRKGCFRELGTPFCYSGSENTGLEDHSGTGMSGLTENLTSRRGAGAPYLASHWPWASFPPLQAAATYPEAQLLPQPNWPSQPPHLHHLSVLECGWACLPVLSFCQDTLSSAPEQAFDSKHEVVIQRDFVASSFPQAIPWLLVFLRLQPL